MKAMKYESLKELCTASVPELREMGEFHKTEADGSGFTLCRRGGKVLGVAHTDVSQSVQSYRQDLVITTSAFEHGWLDDRLGVHALLYNLPKLGIKIDVMLTENEEMGSSTGGCQQAIDVASEYNWIFSMDRKGDDCAMYGYNSDQGKWAEALTTHGWKLDDGNYSCIADMKRAGVKGANFGVGYQKAHTKACVADIQVYERQCERVAIFVREFEAHRFVHPEQNGTISEY